jgi:hypothetical protein
VTHLSADPNRLTFQPEHFEQMLLHRKDDLAILDRLHAEHTGGSKPRNYDFDSYVRMERAGMFRMWGARDAGKPIGVLTYCIRHNKHYGLDWKVALHDLWYVDPEYRSGFVPTMLWRTAERGLRALGVKSIYHGMNAKHDHGRVLERAGYHKIETIFEKVLK